MIVDILGLGPSLNEFNPGGNTTIGVNDIWGKFKTDYVVCVDPPERWPERDRYANIIKARPKQFFVIHEEWKNLLHNYTLLKITTARGDVSQINNPAEVCYSNNSAFVAAVMAYKLGAKKIILHGVDLNSHPSLGRPESLERAIRDFMSLKKILAINGCELEVHSQLSALYEYFKLFSTHGV